MFQMNQKKKRILCAVIVIIVIFAMVLPLLTSVL